MSLKLFASLSLLSSLSLCVGIVRYSDSPDTAVLQNGFVKISFNKLQSVIEFVSADFSGNGVFDKNVLAKPFSLEVSTTEFCLPNSIRTGSNVVWLQQSKTLSSFRAEVTDCTGLIRENWIVSVGQNSRKINIQFLGEVTRAAEAKVVHGMYFTATSAYGLFDEGIVQMMQNTKKCMGSNSSLPRSYFLGNGMAIDVLLEYDNQRQVVIMSKGEDFGSGLQDVIFGNYPNLSRDYKKAWSLCWAAEAGRVTIAAGTKWDYTMTWFPNNFDFPVYMLEDATKQPELPFLDTQTFLTGIYASPAGCLQSYYNNQRGIIAPTISHPDVGYSPNTNFFDPDNFIALSALMYSGDAYLLDQVRNVVERTGETICGIGSDVSSSYCNQPRRRMKHTMVALPRFAQRLHQQSSRCGQIMHHFVNLSPTYESIAGSEQLGPNAFWTLTALRYIEITQDLNWARKMFPYIDLSTQFLTTFFDPSLDLISAPGPLWIDVIVREDYASDSNAMAVPLFRKIADFYDVMGEDAAFASQLRDISERIVLSMNKRLWVSGIPNKLNKSHDADQVDHYITQLGHDGSTRDFVDYDSNLIAVAFGVASDEQARLILNRIDSSEVSHVRGTWCSEKAYTGDRCDCYIVGGSYCGDSIVTLARIGWVDSLARKRMRDTETFDNLLLAPLQRDLVNNVWLYERYDANSTQIRTAYYFE